MLKEATEQHGKDDIVNWADEKCGRTLLHFACGDNKPSPSAVRFLLELKANPNVTSRGGNSPLHTCAHRGGVKHLEIAKLLLDFDVKVRNNMNALGQTPLNVAAVEGISTMVNLLEEHAGTCVGSQTAPMNKMGGGCSDMVARPILPAKPVPAKPASALPPTATSTGPTKPGPADSTVGTPAELGTGQHDFSQPVAKWSVDKVATWLMRFNLSNESVAVFQRYHVDGAQLVRYIAGHEAADACHAVLEKDFLVKSPFLRYRLLGEIKKLK